MKAVYVQAGHSIDYTPSAAVAAGTIGEAWTNARGAVSVICANGELLGLYPEEFEVVDWYDPQQPDKQQNGEE